MAKVRGNDSVRRVIAFAETIGFVPEWTGSTHLKFRKPGRRSVFFGGSPSDRRAHLNAISNLRRADRGDL